MSPRSNKVEIKVRVSPDILRQAKSIAEINGLATAEQARNFLLDGLAAEQKRLKAIGRWPVAELPERVEFVLRKIREGEPISEEDVGVLERALLAND